MGVKHWLMSEMDLCHPIKLSQYPAESDSDTLIKVSITDGHVSIDNMKLLWDGSWEPLYQAVPAKETKAEDNKTDWRTQQKKRKEMERTTKRNYYLIHREKILKSQRERQRQKHAELENLKGAF